MLPTVKFISKSLLKTHQNHFSGLKNARCSSTNKTVEERRMPATSHTRRFLWKTQGSSGYTIRKLKEIDKEQVLDFLRRYFFHNEPMTQAVALLDNPESRCQELEDYAASTLKQGVSIAAVCDNKDAFVGVCINGITRKLEVNPTDKWLDCGNPKFDKILQVLCHLNSEAKVFDLLPDNCESVLELKMMSVHPVWRGKGLLKVMGMESEKIAKAIGACAIRIDATSETSAVTAEKLKYKKVYEVPYKDMPFAPQPSPPDTEARVYIKELY